MDPISLDSIIISEDSNGDGFDLNLVDPPDDYKSSAVNVDSIEIFESVQIETIHDQKKVTVEKTACQIISHTKDEHVENGEIQLTFDNFDVGSSAIENTGNIDLFGALNDGSLNTIETSPVDEKAEDVFIVAEIPVTIEHGETESLSNLQNDDQVKVHLDELQKVDQQKIDDHLNDLHVHDGKKEVNLDENLLSSFKKMEQDSLTQQDAGNNNKNGPQMSMDGLIEQEAGEEKDEEFSFPDIGVRRIQHDSSSDSEFDFELPHEKKKEDHSSVDNDVKLQPVVGQKSVTIETKNVPVETTQSVTFGGNINSITSSAKKIIEYKEEGGVELTQSPSQNKAANEWDNVQTIEAGFMKEGDTVKATLPPSSPLLSYFEMQEELLKTDFSQVKSNIHTSVERHGFSAFKHFFFGPPKIHRNLTSNRENVFCIAASSFDNSNKMHTRALQTIYKSLTGSRFDCSRFGSHWEEIGFQGNDPSTDLRGAGLLGLMNLIYLLRDPKCHIMAKEIYKLSLHPTQNFPFCVMGINMSRITLQSLRDDSLNKECNRRQDVLGVVNDFYAGIYLQMYQLWKSKGKTISDSGFVIKHIETEAKKNPHHVLKNLEAYLQNKKSTSPVNLDNMDPGGDNFLSVCETEAGQY